MKFILHVSYIATILTAILFVICFHVSQLTIPRYIIIKITKDAFISNESFQFRVWSSLSHKFQFKVYVFNITNPKEVQNGRKAVVKEIGPYVYDLIKNIVNVEERLLTDSVVYSEKRIYFFNELQSGNLKESDVFTVINPRFGSFDFELNSTPPGILSVVDDPGRFPYNEDVFVRKTLKQIAFDNTNCINGTTEVPCGQFKVNHEENESNQHNQMSSLFVNESILGPFEIYSGVDNPPMRGQLKNINWKNECDVVRGSNGFFFPPSFDEPPEYIEIYFPEICRSLTFVQENQYPSDTIRRYDIIRKSFSNDKNDCYCDKDKRLNNSTEMSCPPQGFIDICVQMSMWLSLPHFYLANGNPIKGIEGLKPQFDLHSSHINIETVSGTLINASIKLQFNQHVKKLKESQYLENGFDSLYPLAWIEMLYHIPTDNRNFIENNLHTLSVMTILKWSILTLGIVLMSFSILFCLYNEFKSVEKRRKIINCIQFSSKFKKEKLELPVLTSKSEEVVRL